MLKSKGNAIAECIFVIAVLIAVLAPRHDSASRANSRYRSFQSLFNGTNSGPFRFGLFVVTCTLTIRSLFLPDFRYANEHCVEEHTCGDILPWIYYFWVAMESVFLSFLNLGLPYLLQRHLSTVINIVPGQNLKAWLYTVVCSDMLAIFLTAHYSPNFWSIKRLGDGILAFPVIQTLRQYNRILGAQEHSSTLVDTLLILEWGRIILVSGAALGYAMEDRTSGEQNMNSFWVALRLGSTFHGYACHLVQGMLLNLLDEIQDRAYTMARDYPQEQQQQQQPDIVVDTESLVVKL